MMTITAVRTKLSNLYVNFFGNSLPLFFPSHPYLINFNILSNWSAIYVVCPLLYLISQQYYKDQIQAIIYITSAQFLSIYFLV